MSPASERLRRARAVVDALDDYLCACEDLRRLANSAKIEDAAITHSKTRRVLVDLIKAQLT